MADVGVARIYGSFFSAKNANTTKNIVGTLNWMAPEMRFCYENEIKMKTDMTKLDVFSLGLVALFMLDYQNFGIKGKYLNRVSKKNVLDQYLDELDQKSSEKLPKEERLIPNRSFLDYLKKMLTFPSSFPPADDLPDSSEFNIPDRPSIKDLYLYILEVSFFKKKYIIIHFIFYIEK